jgi:hypothetical protein
MDDANDGEETTSFRTPFGREVDMRESHLDALPGKPYSELLDSLNRASQVFGGNSLELERHLGQFVGAPTHVNDLPEGFDVETNRLLHNYLASLATLRDVQRMVRVGMAVIGFHCSHEQINPAQLLRDVQQAARAGFTAAMSSDHFSPWSARQGESGFAWSFLGAALATTRLPFGVVNAQGQRYHPAIIAQAVATLAQMFPGRFWAALGSGEATNERVTGEVWPRKELRDQRLIECVEVIRRLLRGEEVSHEGLVHVNRACR